MGSALCQGCVRKHCNTSASALVDTATHHVRCEATGRSQNAWSGSCAHLVELTLLEQRLEGEQQRPRVRLRVQARLHEGYAIVCRLIARLPC
jgi:hypothetical protein